jgi:hypothetical protein
MNSAEQLHGTAKDKDDCTTLDNDCLSVRFIAYGRDNILNFLNRRREGKVSGEAFWDIKLQKHRALDLDDVSNGNQVSGKFNGKFYDATLIEKEDEWHFQWPDGRTTKCTQASIFSRYCSESKPHECKYCNPSFQHVTATSSQGRGADYRSNRLRVSSKQSINC